MPYPAHHDSRSDPPRAPGRAGARAAGHRRPAVGHPPLLRHPGHDGRRHQPRGGGAGLRHAARDRRGGRREPARGPDALHVQLRDDRAPPRAVRPPGAALRRPLRPGQRDPGHGRRLGGRGPRAAGDLRPGDEVILHEPSYVAVRAGDRVRGRDGRPGRHALRGRLRARPGRRRGRDHAAHQGAVPRLPGQPDRARSSTTPSRTSWPGSPATTTSSSTATRSTTASRTARTATGRSRPSPGCASGRSSWAASPRRTR